METLKQNFLHRHPGLEQKSGLDENHVIVDRKDWEKARELITDPFIIGKKRIGIIGCPGYSGWEGIICGMDEARTIVIRKENISKYPDLPESIDEWPESEDAERYIGQLKLELSFEHFRNEFLNQPPLIERAKILAQEFKSLGENMIDLNSQKKKKTKGYERPYKFHK